MYFTTLFSTQFLENSDAQLITIKKFNQEMDNDYPTFSICFKGTKFQWYHDFEIFDSYGLNGTQYQLMLEGETALKYDRNDVMRTYHKTPVLVNEGRDIDFSEYHLSTKDLMSDFLRSIHYSAENPSMDFNISSTTDWNETESRPLHLSYQTPKTICFSRNSSDILTSYRLYDMITLNSSAIKASVLPPLERGDTQMDIFVHYPNQLLQSFGKAKYSTTFSHLLSTLNDTNPKVLEIKLSENKRLRKRVNSKDPCTKTIQDYDRYFQLQVAEHLGCVPIYFKQAMNNESNIQECHTKSELMEAQFIIDNYDKFLNEIEKPCDEMMVLTIDSVDNNPNPRPKDIAIKFIYTEKVYEEIQYTKAIGFESWLSNVGGFVGIFLGYSMMQFPELLLFFTTIFNYERRNHLSGKYLLFLIYFLDNIQQKTRYYRNRFKNGNIHFIYRHCKKNQGQNAELFSTKNLNMAPQRRYHIIGSLLLICHVFCLR